MTKQSAAFKTLTMSELVPLVGDLDAATLQAIVDTGANQAEVEWAVRRASGMVSGLPEERRALVGRAAAVYDILMADPDFESEEPA